MYVSATSKVVLALIFCAAIFSGCGGSGGSGDDEPSGDGGGNSGTDIFSPDAYEEASSANQSLSGIWLMLEEYERDSSRIDYQYQQTGQATTIHEETQRRELYVIADDEVSPYPSPRVSGCGEPEFLQVQGDRLSFTDNRGVNYTGAHENRTRITGTTQYSQGSGTSTSESQQGRFTMIKLAPLPAGFEIDATSDAHEAFYDSDTKYLEPLGTVTFIGEGNYGSLSESGPVTCFLHEETIYTRTTPVATFRQTITNLWAGTERSLRVYLYRVQLPVGEPFIEIGADGTSDWLEIDNDASSDAITGQSSVFIEGSSHIAIEGSIRDAEEGDVETSIDITLP